jgi:hypothetical protein
LQKLKHDDSNRTYQYEKKPVGREMFGTQKELSNRAPINDTSERSASRTSGVTTVNQTGAGAIGKDGKAIPVPIEESNDAGGNDEDYYSEDNDQT